MSRQRHLLTAILAVILTVLVSGCKSGSNEVPSQTSPTVRKLQGTTWHYYKQVVHQAHTDEVNNRDVYWTFLVDSYGSHSYKMLIKGIQSTSLNWSVSNDSQNMRDNLWIDDNSNPAELAQSICCSKHTILKLTDAELVLGDDSHEIYLRKVPYNEFSESD